MVIHARILPNSLTCTDLIFTDQPGLVVNKSVHPILQENCHHQIKYYKLKLQIKCPPPYQSLVWDFKRARANAITDAMNQVGLAFVSSCKNVSQ